MLTAKRIYLYGVLLASLVLVSWGLADLLRFAFDELSRLVSSRPAWTAGFSGEELSRAIALTLVAGSIFIVHAALVRRTLRGSPAAVADERASAARSSYFFLALGGTGLALLISAYELVQAAIDSLVFGLRGYELTWPLGGVIVFGAVWSAHLAARRIDLRSAPARLAGDWLTRAYLYGALLLSCLLAAWQLGDGLTVVGRAVLDLEPTWVVGPMWEEEFAAAIAGATIGTVAWISHWLIAGRLLAAPDPMGQAHRTARTRQGYFLTVVLISAACVLGFAALGLQPALAEVAGTARPVAGPPLAEEVLGPWLMALPFLAVWWWHLRTAAAEAYVMGGELGRRTVRRTGRLLVAFVGLAGSCVGVAWQLRILFHEATVSSQIELHVSAAAPDDVTSALALALVGLSLWLPAWALSHRDRTQDVAEVALSTSRRAYLMLVSGVAVIAAMGALAYLVWQGARSLLESGVVGDTSWSFAILTVAVVVLGYHLWQLRADVAVAGATGPQVAEPAPETDRVIETIEISAPAGADFKVLNAAIRTELPEGFEARIVTRDTPV